MISLMINHIPKIFRYNDNQLKDIPLYKQIQLETDERTKSKQRNCEEHQLKAKTYLLP